MNRLFLGLLVFVPATVVSAWLGGGTLTFVLAALALVPLARFMGVATEHLADRLGSGLGGLMNATFGNAAELIVALAALKAGQTAVVKASITGSVLGNLLLVLGAAVLAGGIGRQRQLFSATAALSSSALMFLAVTGLVVPDLFHLTRGAAANAVMRPMSLIVSGVLLALYGLSLLFSLKTHAAMFAGEEDAAVDPPDGPPGQRAGPEWSLGKALGVLLAATAATVLVAELLVHALEPAIASLGVTHTFVGVVVIAVVGNAAEHSTAVLMAIKDRMDLAFGIAFESSKQIALFVAPVLVLISGFLGHPLTLEFSHMEVLGLALATGATTLICLDGESNWLEGAMLLAVYAVLAVAFFFTP